MWRRRILGLTVVLEVVTGLLLLFAPSTLIRLMLGTAAAGAAEVVGRVAGAALVALGAATWPSAGDSLPRALRGMLTYSVLVTLYFVYLIVRGEWLGPLLVPVTVVHAALTIALGAAWVTERAGDLGS